MPYSNRQQQNIGFECYKDARAQSTICGGPYLKTEGISLSHGCSKWKKSLKKMIKSPTQKTDKAEMY